MDELLDTADALDAGGWTPLHFAAFKTNAALVTALVEGGADPNAQDENGQTPLHFATKITRSRW